MLNHEKLIINTFNINDLHTSIFNYLLPEDLLNLRLVNKFFYKLLKFCPDVLIWHLKTKIHFYYLINYNHQPLSFIEFYNKNFHIKNNKSFLMEEARRSFSSVKEGLIKPKFYDYIHTADADGYSLKDWIFIKNLNNSNQYNEEELSILLKKIIMLDHDKLLATVLNRLSDINQKIMVLDQKSQVRVSILVFAVFYKKSKCISLILRESADINLAETNNNYSLLNYAAVNFNREEYSELLNLLKNQLSAQYPANPVPAVHTAGINFNLDLLKYFDEQGKINDTFSANQITTSVISEVSSEFTFYLNKYLDKLFFVDDVTHEAVVYIEHLSKGVATLNFLLVKIKLNLFADRQKVSLLLKECAIGYAKLSALAKSKNNSKSLTAKKILEMLIPLIHFLLKSIDINSDVYKFSLSYLYGKNLINAYMEAYIVKDTNNDQSDCSIFASTLTQQLSALPKRRYFSLFKELRNLQLLNPQHILPIKKELSLADSDPETHQAVEITLIFQTIFIMFFSLSFLFKELSKYPEKIQLSFYYSLFEEIVLSTIWVSMYFIKNKHSEIMINQIEKKIISFSNFFNAISEKLSSLLNGQQNEVFNNEHTNPVKSLPNEYKELELYNIDEDCSQNQLKILSDSNDIKNNPITEIIIEEPPFIMNNYSL